jgi:hypothetical protein
MPLKHPTETLLVFLLGLVIVLTGIVLPTLPLLPQGILPWMIVLLLTLAYPLSLYGLLKRNRADYTFRLLHFLPALMAGIWLILALLGLRFSPARFLLRVYLFAWTLPAVIVSFLLIAAFCLEVIRRRVPRLILLSVLLVPFLVLGIVGSRFQTSTKIASLLWRGEWWNITGQPLPASQSGAVVSSHAVIASSRQSEPPVFGSSSSRPPSLAGAGPEDVLSLIALTFLPLYTAVLHQRARKRLL